MRLLEEPERWYASRWPASRELLADDCIVRLRQGSARGDARRAGSDWLVELAEASNCRRSVDEYVYAVGLIAAVWAGRLTNAGV